MFAAGASPVLAATRTVQSTQIGDMKVTTVSDGYIDFPTGAYTNVDTEVLAGLGDNLRLGANVWIIRSGARNILVDAGSGSFMGDAAPGVGNLNERLHEAGTTAREITDVIVTHMHPDHIGGLLVGGQIAYPNAQFHVSNDEWGFWTSEELLSAAPEPNRPMIMGIQSIATAIKERVTFHQGAYDLGAGVSVEPAPGHTPGHMVVRVSSGGQQFFLLGDAVISQNLQFQYPEVYSAFDAVPDLSVKTRKDLFDMLAADNIAFSATHLAFPGAGYVSKRGRGYLFTPVA